MITITLNTLMLEMDVLKMDDAENDAEDDEDDDTDVFEVPQITPRHLSSGYSALPEVPIYAEVWLEQWVLSLARGHTINRSHTPIDEDTDENTDEDEGED